MGTAARVLQPGSGRIFRRANIRFVDGIYVGQGVCTNALGAVNLVMPFVMVVNALFQLTTIGGVAIIAVRLGRGDAQGANHAFMHAVAGTIVISAALMLAGTCLTGPLCRLMGASDTFYQLTTEYLFWYSVFIIPSGLSTALQGFCRNDGSPVLVSAATIIGTVVNIIGDWLLIFPLKMGVAGAAIATGVSQLVTLLIHFIRKKGVLRFCRFRVDGALFGADAATLAYTVRVMPLYSWGFVVVGFTTNISSYLYSTKRSREADVISILRSFVFNTLVILLLPRILGGDVIWHTFGIAEAVVLLISVILLKRSERSGIVFN